METSHVTRRELLALGSAAGVALAAGGLAHAAEPADAEPFPKNATEALARLKAGNERFAAGKTLHAHESADWRKHLVATQQPFATILGCADSRVPVELVFDQGFGDLFVSRVAGNVIAPDIVGTLEYAVAHLSTPLIVVVGHQNCGAVTAALKALAGPVKELPGIETLLDLIEPGLPKNLRTMPAAEQIGVAVEANVRWSLKQLMEINAVKQAVVTKRVELQGAVYELATGRVRFLS